MWASIVGISILYPLSRLKRRWHGSCQHGWNIRNPLKGWGGWNRFSCSNPSPAAAPRRRQRMWAPSVAALAAGIAPAARDRAHTPAHSLPCPPSSPGLQSLASWARRCRPSTSPPWTCSRRRGPRRRRGGSRRARDSRGTAWSARAATTSTGRARRLRTCRLCCSTGTCSSFFLLGPRTWILAPRVLRCPSSPSAHPPRSPPPSHAAASCTSACRWCLR